MGIVSMAKICNKEQKLHDDDGAVKIGAFGRFFVACAGEQEGKKLRACYTQ
jgi:hypothetical protein